MIRIRNLAVPFTETASLEDLAAKRLMLPPQQIAGVVIVRKAVDARRYHGAPIQFVYILDVRLEPKLEKKVLQKLRRDRNVEAAPEPEAAAPRSTRSRTCSSARAARGRSPMASSRRASTTRT